MAIAGAILAMLLLAPAARGAEEFPERPGKAVVTKICGGCHGLKLLAPMRRTREQWRTAAEEMLGKGMKAEEAEIEQAAAYLGRYLNRLNVNKASAADLADVLDLTGAEAREVVAHRERNGPIPDIETLSAAAGVAPEKWGGRRDRIAFR